VKAMSVSVKNNRIRYYLIAGIGGLLLGCSFPPSPLYSLAYIAFFPLFWIYEEVDKIGTRLWYTYIFLIVFHCSTLYWVGGFVVGKDIWMMAAGGLLLLIHPVFYLPFVLAALWVRKKAGRMAGYVAFCLLWVGFEYLHSLGEYAFPWIQLGNSQAYDTARIQIFEFTSVYGLSFIILAFNCIVFEITRIILNERKFFSSQTTILISILIVLFFGPLIYGSVVKNSYKNNSASPIAIGIVQANIDPWQKWDGETQSPEEQVQIHLQKTEMLSFYHPDLIIWPETAIPVYIFSPRYSSLLQKIQSSIDSFNVPLFTGLPTYRIFDSTEAPVTADQIGKSNLFVESYNSAALFDSNGGIEKVYQKIILVPFAERIPYAETFRFLIEPLKWNVGISSWGKGADTAVFELSMHDSMRVKFGGMICYESVFPNFVREFVRRGANFLIVITNDSWWGNTSGAYQHASYASLRAVETRRWIVQAANGGISLVVDPTGVVRYRTHLYEQNAFIAYIAPETKETFYVQHGDIFAQICLFGGLVMIIFTIFTNVRQHRGG